MEDRSRFDLEADRYLDGMKKTPLQKMVERVIVEAFEEHDKRDELMSVYSDVYKEKHGIRPRWMMTRMADMSVEQIEAELDRLMDEPETVDYDDFTEHGSDEPLAIEPGAIGVTSEPIEPDDEFETMPKQVGMKRDELGREKRNGGFAGDAGRKHMKMSRGR
jgi:hypothetical protein